MRKSKEFLEPTGGEQSFRQILAEMKIKEEERAKEDKTGTPWTLINPELITPQNLEIFQHFYNGELEIAQEESRVAKMNLEKIKNEQSKRANEALLLWIDDKISAEIARRELQEEKEKDNY